MLDMDMEIIKDFISGLSERTQKSYMYEFNRLYNYLKDKHKRDISLLEVTVNDVRDFKEYLTRYKYKKRTKEEQYSHYDSNTIIRILHTFMSFYDKCIKDRREINGKQLSSNPFHGVEVPRVETEYINADKIPTEVQNQKLLKTAKESGKRDYAIVLLFETAHVTVQEMLNFCWADLLQDGMDNWFIRVSTRAGKEKRDIPLTDEVVEVLLAYRIEQRLPVYIDYVNEVDKKVILNYKGDPIKEIGIRSILEKLCEKADIPKVTPKELIHLGTLLEIMGGASDMQLLEQTGLTRISYIKNRYKYAKRKYLHEPACKKVKLPPH